MNDPVTRELDLRTASSRDLERAMRRGAREALALHKQAGNPVVVWDWDRNEVVTVPPEEIPPDPETVTDG
jgi:hypothetical protein